ARRQSSDECTGRPGCSILRRAGNPVSGLLAIQLWEKAAGLPQRLQAAQRLPASRTTSVLCPLDLPGPHCPPPDPTPSAFGPHPGTSGCSIPDTSTPLVRPQGQSVTPTPASARTLAEELPSARRRGAAARLPAPARPP